MQQGLPFDAPATTTDSEVAPISVSRIAPTSDSAIAPTSDVAIAPTSDSAVAPSFYFVRHRRARRYLVRVDLDGRVRVTIPRGGSRREADAFAQTHLDWIHRQRSRLTPSSVSLQERRLLWARAAAELPSRLLALARDHGLSVAKVSVRNQRSRWGSCGRDGHITLNWRLVVMPDWVCDYVLIHELMHLRRHDHSPDYWKLVAAVFPRYREARAWLRAHGSALQ